MLLKYLSYIVTISSPESIRNQWNDQKVDGRKTKKELLRGGFGVQSQFSAKALLERKIDIWVLPPHWRIHFPVFRKGVLRRGNISRWVLPFLLAKLFWDFPKEIKMKYLRQSERKEGSGRKEKIDFSIAGFLPSEVIFRIRWKAATVSMVSKRIDCRLFLEKD